MVKAQTLKLLPVLTRMHISGTRENRTGYRFVCQSESVPGFYPHSSTAEAKMLIRTFNVHVKRFICALQKVLEFRSLVLEMSLNVLEFCSDKTLRTLQLHRLSHNISHNIHMFCQALSMTLQ